MPALKGPRAECAYTALDRDRVERPHRLPPVGQIWAICLATRRIVGNLSSRSCHSQDRERRADERRTAEVLISPVR